MFDIPEHLPMGVNKDGQGPVDEGDPEYDRTVCWCGKTGCEFVGERPRETTAKVIDPPCPVCSEPMDVENIVWVWNAKFYCSEKCCRQAAHA